MKIKAFIQLFLILTILSSCTQKSSIEENNSQLNSSSETNSSNISLSAFDLDTNRDGLSNVKAIIKTIHGNITLRFYPKQAPNTVTRVLQLLNDGFYDGLPFHRVVEGGFIQTGDPTSTGKGGSGVILKAEFSELQHIKGTVAMARSHNDVDSADSQFYIALTTLPHLDGKYTIFGQVTEGIEVLDKIKKDDKILSFQVSQ